MSGVVSIINSRSDTFLSASKLFFSERNHKKGRKLFSNTELAYPYTKIDNKSVLKARNGIMLIDLRKNKIDFSREFTHDFLLRIRPYDIAIFFITKKVSDIPKIVRRMTGFIIKPISYYSCAFPIKSYRLDIIMPSQKRVLKSYSLDRFVKKVKRRK